MYEDIKNQAKLTANEICDIAGLKSGQILVVGCSTSEVCGDKIGTNSNFEVAQAFQLTDQIFREFGTVSGSGPDAGLSVAGVAFGIEMFINHVRSSSGKS